MPTSILSTDVVTYIYINVGVADSKGLTYI